LKKTSFPKFNRKLLLSILLPVVGVGVIISIIAVYYLAPPLFESIENRIDSELKLASSFGLQICETDANYLFELRLEDDAEMNEASKNQALEEILKIGHQFQNIRMLVIENQQTIRGASEDFQTDQITIGQLKKKTGPVVASSLWANPVRLHSRYFPFWNWHVISYIHERDYVKPVRLAKNIVYLGTFGVLWFVWLALLVMVIFFVREPLRKIITATEGVAGGSFAKIDIKRGDEIGQVVQAFNSMVDSLKEKNKEVTTLINALRDSEQRYRILFESAVEGITVIEIDTRHFKYANPAMCAMLGYSEDALRHMNLEDIHPEEDLEFVLSEFAAISANRKALVSDVPCKRKDGGIFHVDIKGTKVLFEQTECNLCFFTDITHRKQAEEETRELQKQLQRAEKMEALGLLAGGVAHDLNNILSGLVSYPELLLMDLAEDSPMRQPIKTIERSGKKAAAIVQDLLTLARRGVAVTEIVNLNHIIEEFLESPECAKIKKFHPKFDLQVNLDAQLLNIMGSPVHLSKTIMNLVSNAAEALPDGGRAIIATKSQYVDQKLKGYDEVAEGDYAVLSVLDNGVGISVEDLEKIFEPFYTKKVMGRSGTGLGMAVVWGTVKDHSGYINVTSRKGSGTLFELFFPVTREKTETDSAPVALKEYSGNGEKILVVDDVPEQREIASIILTRLGYRVEVVSSGEMAVEYLQTRSVDLMILDMIMDPGIDGLDTYRKILAFRPGQKAIIASGFSETGRVKEAQRLGARRYVRKPYTTETIGLAVKEELEK
jgi:PAS domain S-box-containing protein